MKTSRYTEAQIIAILRQAEGGVPVAELCCEHGMSSASLCKWAQNPASRGRSVTPLCQGSCRPH